MDPFPPSPPLPLVVGFGENSVDHVYRLPRCPLPGTALAKVRITEHEIRAGGQVATTLATCVQCGLGARYIGTFGNDAQGELIRAEMARRGIDIATALVRDAPNRSALILVDDAGERVVLWQRDDRLSMAPGDVRQEWLAAATLVHVDGTDESAAASIAAMARARGLPVTCDIDRVTPLTRSLLDSVTVAVFAEHVPAALTGERDPEKALRALRRSHPGRLVVTLGRNGAAMLDGDRYVHVPGYPVRVVDSTGAGDVFRGAFIHALLRGDAAEEILRFANAAAAVSCTKAGAIEGVPTLEEVRALLSGRP